MKSKFIMIFQDEDIHYDNKAIWELKFMIIPKEIRTSEKLDVTECRRFVTNQEFDI